MSKTNNYKSSASVIVSGPGTMFNEVTRHKPTSIRINENTNTNAVTVTRYKKRNKKIKNK